jgi:acyl carrier protein
MTHAEILERLQPIFDNLFMDPITLTPDLSAADVAEWDSMLQISIIVAVESAFGVRFRVGEVEGTKNVGEFVALIAERLKAG